MNELARHLQHRPAHAAFKTTEFDEILLLGYNFLRWAIRDRCDTLRFTAQGAAWLRDDATIGQLAQSPKQTLSFRAAMARILERDEIVRRHLRRVSETPDEIIYRIVGDGEALSSLAGATDNTPARADD